MQRLSGVHGLRAVAALGVIVYHVAYVPKINPPLPPVIDHIAPHLGACVHLFFVISAFSLLHSFYGKPQGEGWVGRYLVRRIFRIGPLFWTALALYAVLLHSNINASQLAANALFVFNFVPKLHDSWVWAGWSIGVEMPFYLCLPFVIQRVTRPKTALILALSTLALGMASRLILERMSLPQTYANLAFTSNLSFLLRRDVTR